jgi:hypothetical protein
MKFLAVITLVFIILNIILCPIVSTHISGHEGCMAGFVNHIEDMQAFLFAMVSVFVFLIIFLFVSSVDFLNFDIFQKSFLYLRKIILPDKTKINWLAILFHAPPCFR